MRLDKFLLILALFNFSLIASMSLKDRNICRQCLEHLDNLVKDKSSESCTVKDNRRDIQQNNLMCYEIYYYLYYFKQNYFFGGSDRCSACAYLDKCQYDECTSFTLKNSRSPNLQEFQHAKNYTQLPASTLNDSINFLSVKEDPVLGPEPDLVSEHFNIEKLKISHILDELQNLVRIHQLASRVKKQIVNLIVREKMKREKMIESTSQIEKISTSDNEKNYQVEIRQVCGEFLKLVKKSEWLIERDFSADDKQKVKQVREYILEFTEALNQLYHLADSIDKSNKRLFKFVSETSLNEQNDYEAVQHKAGESFPNKPSERINAENKPKDDKTQNLTNEVHSILAEIGKLEKAQKNLEKAFHTNSEMVKLIPELKEEISSQKKSLEEVKKYQSLKNATHQSPTMNKTNNEEKRSRKNVKPTVEIELDDFVQREEQLAKWPFRRRSRTKYNHGKKLR